MEVKQILGIIIACVAVCILIGICSIIRGKSDAEDSESEPAVTSAVYTSATTTTDFWESLRKEQETTAETTTVPNTDTISEEDIPSDEQDTPNDDDTANAETTAAPENTDENSDNTNPTDETSAESGETTATTASQESAYSNPNVDADGHYHIVITQ